MNIGTYISDAYEELKSNVTWTNATEVQKYTVIVAVFSIVFALATWGTDEVFTKALEGFFKWLKS